MTVNSKMLFYHFMKKSSRTIKYQIIKYVIKMEGHKNSLLQSKMLQNNVTNLIFFSKQNSEIIYLIEDNKKYGQA